MLGKVAAKVSRVPRSGFGSHGLKTIAAVVVGMAVGMGMLVGFAVAASKATIQATEFKVAHGQTGEASAKCPGTTRALGGGVVQSGAASFGLTVQASGPLDETGVTLNTNTGDIAKQWYATVYNGGAELTFRAFAICSPAKNATIQATEFKVANGQTGEAFAKCPGTTRALGGGVVEIGAASAGVRVRASGPLDETGVTLNTNTGDIAKQWYAAVGNNSGAERTFRVFAICKA